MSVAADPPVRSATAGGLAFVLLWSNGYIAAEFGLSGSGAFTLAVLRFLGSGLIIGAWLLWRRPRQADRSDLQHAAFAGLLSAICVKSCVSK